MQVKPALQLCLSYGRGRQCAFLLHLSVGYWGADMTRMPHPRTYDYNHTHRCTMGVRAGRFNQWHCYPTPTPTRLSVEQLPRLSGWGGGVVHATVGVHHCWSLFLSRKEERKGGRWSGSCIHNDCQHFLLQVLTEPLNLSDSLLANIFNAVTFTFLTFK